MALEGKPAKDGARPFEDVPQVRDRARRVDLLHRRGISVGKKARAHTVQFSAYFNLSLTRKYVSFHSHLFSPLALCARDTTTPSAAAAQFIEHVSKSVNFTPFDTRWVPCSAKFVLLGIHPRGTGALKIYEMDQGDLKLVAEV